MSKFLKWVGLASLVDLLAAQFVSPKRIRRRVSPAVTLEANTATTPEVSKILERACNDCHSEKNVWRWYSRVAPFSWLQMADVGMGRDEVNFSRWKEYSAKQQANMLKNKCQIVRESDMPLWFYKPLHQGSGLSSGEVQQLCDWTAKEIEQLGK